MSQLKILSSTGSQANHIDVVSDNSSYVGIATRNNVNLVLSASGDGAIQAQVTDSAVGGGNARGTNAVDFQLDRDAATEVASGQRSALVGGFGNSATVLDSGVFVGTDNAAGSQEAAVVGGNNNTAAANASVIVGGQTNQTVSADRSIILGGLSNDTSAQESVVLGGRNNLVSAERGVAMGANGLADHPTSFAFSGGATGTQTAGDVYRGKSQGQLVHLVHRTTASEEKGLNSFSTELAVPSNTAFGITGKVIAWNESDTTVSDWNIDILCYESGGTITFVAGNGTQTIVNSDDAGVPQLVVSGTGTNINFQATGLASKNIRWSGALLITRAAT